MGKLHFWERLDNAVLKHSDHYLSFSEHDVLRDFALYLISARSEQAKAQLWRIVREKEHNGQALICLTWFGDKRDMISLYPYMLKDASLPYQFLRNYGSERNDHRLSCLRTDRRRVTNRQSL